MKKKTVLFINGHLKAGGCERSLVDVLKELDYSRYDVDLLLLEQEGDYRAEIPDEVNILLYSLDDSFGTFGKTIIKALKGRNWFSLLFRIIYMLSRKVGSNWLALANGLFKKLKKEYDVIIAYRPGICTELAAYTFKGKKKVSWWHHGEINLSESEKAQLRKEYAKMDTIVAVSKSSWNLITDAFPEIQGRTVIIPNMVSQIEIKRKALEYTVELNSDILNIVSVGRMSPEKNMQLCPLIGDELAKRGIQFKWYLIGDGEEFKKIENLIFQHKLENKFVLTGRLCNPYPYMSAASILVHPSLVESQGITIIEGMALGVPVVVVESMGPKEYIDTGRNGFLVKSDVQEIADAICGLYVNPNKLQQCRIMAIHTSEFFAPDTVVRKVVQLIE